MRQERINAHDSSNMGAIIGRYRARLGMLTTYPAVQQWPDSMVKGRSAATAAVRTMSSAIALLLPDHLAETLLSRHGDGSDIDQASGPQRRILFVSFKCGIGVRIAKDPHSHTKPVDSFLTTGNACFRLIYRHDHSSWHVDPHEIEAAVAMTAWSHRSYDRTFRIIGICVPESVLLNAPSHLSLQEWECANTVFSELVERPLDFSTTAAKSTVSREEPVIHYPENVFHMLGWNAVPWSKLSTPLQCVAYGRDLDASSNLIWAQEIFCYFLVEFLQASDNPLGESYFVKTKDGYRIRNSRVDTLIDYFVESGHGSKGDAVLCILPVIAASKRLSPVRDVIVSVLKSVSEAIKSEQFGDARSKLIWLARLLKFDSDSAQVRQWCLLKCWLYRLDSWKGHAREGQSFQGSLSQDIDMIDSLHLDSEAKTSARDLFMRLWQMFCHMNEKRLNKSWNQQLDGLFGDVPYTQCDFKSCFEGDDVYGTLICVPSLASKPDGKLLMQLLEREESSWQPVIRAFLSLEPELDLFEHRGRNAFSLACGLGATTFVIELLVSLPSKERKRLLIQHDTTRRRWTPVHYAIRADRKNVIAVLGPELMQYWYLTCISTNAAKDAWVRDYMNGNFREMIVSEDVNPDLQRSEQEVEETDGGKAAIQEVTCPEELWQAVKESLRPTE